MLQRLRAARQNEDGFTLVELLIVIIILGVLAGIVVFAVNGITDRGELAACKADVQSVQTAAEAYYAEHTGYPATMDGLVPEFLKAAPHPNTTKYTINWSQTNGTVQGVMTADHKDCITGVVVVTP